MIFPSTIDLKGLDVKLIIGAIVVAVSITGCGKTEAQKQEETNANLVVMGEQYVRARLKDPNSAEFRNQFIGKKGLPCGEVNAKNSFGGFIGFKRFIVVSKEMTVMEADMKEGEFETSWSQICK